MAANRAPKQNTKQNHNCHLFVLSMILLVDFMLASLNAF
jgi:hypothetical protein